MQALAALDAVYCPEWEYRYYSFDCNWGTDQQMGSIRNGSGDDVYVLFNNEGCFLKGFSHEYPMGAKSYDAFYTSVPEVFLEASREPAFSPHNVNFCFWRHKGGSEWQSALPHDTLDSDIFFLIQGLNEEAKSYQAFASDYFEIETDIEHISSAYQHIAMTQPLAEAMNKDIIYSELVESLNEIGYPVAGLSSL